MPLAGLGLRAEFPNQPNWDSSGKSWRSVWECQAKQANSLSKQAFLNLSQEAEQAHGQHHLHEKQDPSP